MAIFNGNPNTTIVINYAPTEGSERAEDHYETLTNAVNGIPKHHMVTECGDYNAHLGKESAPCTYHETTNKNGKLLLDHATECNLHITNTAFKKRKGKLWTYISDMNNRKSQIDYILINRKWKNSIHNCEACNSFSSLGSDHRLLTVKIKLSLRMTKTPQRSTTGHHSETPNYNNFTPLLYATDMPSSAPTTTPSPKSTAILY